MRSFIRANHKIKVTSVRCINADGSMLGVIATRDAMKMAQEQGLDLVELSPNAVPPVCRIMDFGKFRYDESIKQKQARKQQMLHNKAIKEMKFHANVAEHDYATKVSHIRDFLKDGHKVKISLQFRGRENAHRELGFEVVSRVLKECEDICVVEMTPRMMGRTIVAMMGLRQGKVQQRSHQASSSQTARKPPQPAAAPAPQPAKDAAVEPPAAPAEAAAEPGSGQGVSDA